MNILLISGHGAGDSGATGNGYQEQALTREITAGVKAKLDKYAKVDIYPTNRDAYSDLVSGRFAVNPANYDYVLEVHLNSGGTPYGSGTEIYVTSSEKVVTVEQTIVNNVAQIFPPARAGGVKVYNWGVINYIKGKGVSAALLEVFFINNPNEVNKYQANKDAVYTAIANGIISGFGLGTTQKPTVVNPPAAKPQPSTDLTQVARDVINGKYGNGNDRKKNVKAAGYDYDKVQAIVNQLLGQGGSAPAPAKKSNQEIAQEVLAGQWGNGQDRVNRLTNAGYDYNAIQAIVNGGAAPARPSVDIYDLARRTLRGDFGNGEQRKAALGDNYQAVQDLINSGKV